MASRGLWTNPRQRLRSSRAPTKLWVGNRDDTSVPVLPILRCSGAPRRIFFGRILSLRWERGRVTRSGGVKKFAYPVDESASHSDSWIRTSSSDGDGRQEHGSIKQKGQQGTLKQSPAVRSQSLKWIHISRRVITGLLPFDRLLKIS